MADQLYFSRDTKIYIEIGSAIWEVPVLDGFSFSQATNSSEVTLSEMSGTGGSSRRGRRMFNDSFAPAEWSFSTYMRPFTSTGTGSGAASTVDGDHHAVEEVLWGLFAGPAHYQGQEFKDEAGGTAYISHSGTSADIDFGQSNKSTLGTANIYFAMGGANDTKTVYKISDCVVNEMAADFDIDGIATINWSGLGKIITEATAPTATVTEAITSTGNFIRNRLTSLTATSTGTGNFESAYDLVLTGGNVTISNNITFLTPETLGVVNQPLGHVTGTRSVSGSFTCYLNAETGSSADLFEDIIESTDTITNDFGLLFKIGGGATPRIELNMAQCHLEVPTHSIDDVISLETNFHALPSSIDGTDELTIKYVGE